ncbi:MAG: Rpn family recombination-promoting nuclease/putative transposase [Oscillospiraceae bacterium]|nr:Rpn family recombination-promoting nuclease/putative transposase [Oscillospiraceae bacterium]
MFDQKSSVEFSDLLEIHTLELSKLPPNADGTELYDWAKFINAETEEELTMIAERNPQFQPTVVRLRELSADEKARDLYERREKARRDHNMFVRGAKQEGIIEGRIEGRVEGRSERSFEIAMRLLERGRPIEEIMEDTGLTHREIERLQLH